MASADVNVAVTLNVRPIIDALDTLGAAMQSLADACLTARDKLEEADTGVPVEMDGDL